MIYIRPRLRLGILFELVTLGTDGSKLYMPQAGFPSKEPLSMQLISATKLNSLMR